MSWYMAPLEASGSLAARLVFVIILRDILTLKHQSPSNINLHTITRSNIPSQMHR